MTISIISSVTYNHDFINAKPAGEASISANAGDIILFHATHDGSSSTSWSNIQWGTASFTSLARFDDLYHQEYWWTKADSTGTYPLTRSTVSAEYLRGSYSITVLRSSGNNFATVPAVLQAHSFGTVAPTLPSLTYTLTGSQLALNILSATTSTPGWVNAEPNTWTPGGTGTALTVAGASGSYWNSRTWISQTTGAGSHTATWTPAVNAQYNYATLVFTETLSTITSIDTDDKVEIGQAISVITNGFTARPVASNPSTISLTLTGGSANSWTGTVGDRSEGFAFPLLPFTVPLTLTNGSETDTRNVTFTRKSTESEIKFATPIVDDNTYIGWHLSNAGYTVDGGTLYYVPYSNLTIGTDSGISVLIAGSINGWWRPLNGLGAGNIYQVTFNVSASGAVVSISLVTLIANSTSPRFDAQYPLGNRP